MDVGRCVEALFDSHWGIVNLRNLYLYFLLQVFTRKSRVLEGPWISFYFLNLQ